MTEVEWLACTDPTPMLEYLRGKASDRKLRLFACAVCRRAWDTLTPRRIRRAVELGEEYADGHATVLDLHRGRSQACEAAADFVHGTHRRLVNRDVSVEEVRLRLACDVVYHHEPFLIGRLRWHADDVDLLTVGPPLLRDIVGNTFRPPSRLTPCLLGWSDGLIVKLAEAAYEYRSLPSGHLDLNRLAILADALEDAGCADGPLLSHLRAVGPHVRGCWVIDMLTGSE